MSDLHLEFGSPDIITYVDDKDIIDVFVIAGDISTGLHSVKSLYELAKCLYPKKLLYVTGNHDYYYHSRKKIDNLLLELELECPNFILLNHSTYIYNGIVFIGSTGWQMTDNYNEYDYPMNDFRLIDDHSENVKMWSMEDYEYISSMLKVYQNDKTVVISHVPPTIKALDLNSKDVINKGLLLKAYFNYYDDVIDKYTPNYWICGHIHDTVQIKYKSTMFLRNGYGYHGINRQNLQFDKNKYIIA